jgi:hypothetical protein
MHLIGIESNFMHEKVILKAQGAPTSYKFHIKILTFLISIKGITSF